MDQKLLLLINRDWTHPALDRAMAVASSFDFWIPFILLLAAWVAWRGGVRARAFLLVAALAAGLADGAIAAPLKRLVARPRPHEVQAGVRIVDLAGAKPRFLALAKPLRIKMNKTAPSGPPGGRSFPSSHTMNTMAVAAVAACFFRPWGLLGFLPALLVAYSRIYTGSHWPSDVLGSALMGVAWGILVALTAAKLWPAACRRWWPQLRTSHPHLLTA